MTWPEAAAAGRADAKSRHRACAFRHVLIALGALLCLAALAPAAQAHGPIAPVASSYLAKVGRVPAGLEAKVVDGDLRMWLKVPATMTVVVLDYRGAPYLRFSSSGVQVNTNSSMYYLNQTPVAETPPTYLSRTTPPSWQHVSSGHSYGWHDGRLHALAAVALAPGTRYVGGWSIPILLDGRASTLSGGVWHAADPSIVWFWPIVVLLACVLAAWRLRDPALDARLARVLGVTALIALAVVSIGRGLHGRPNIGVGQLIEMAIILAFVAWGLRRMSRKRPGYFAYFLISFVALWEGVSLLSTLLNGFVLVALPATVARIATVLCLAAGAAIPLLVLRLAEQSKSAQNSATRPATEDQDPEALHNAHRVG